jgi:RNA polymerase-interacting CarD/CdnL/TRCF family regulator
MISLYDSTPGNQNKEKCAIIILFEGLEFAVNVDGFAGIHSEAVFYLSLIGRRIRFMKWKTNDVVIYKNNGVCLINRTEEMDLTGNGLRKYYVLTQYYKPQMTIYVEVPVGDEIFRTPLSIAEVNNIIGAYKESDWISNDRDRQMSFDARISNGSYGDLLAVIGALHRKRSEKIKNGKKPRVVDEKELMRAESVINQTFAYSLKIEPDQVPGYIKKAIKEYK